MSTVTPAFSLLTIMESARFSRRIGQTHAAMKSTTVQQTSHIRAYWYAWLGIAAVALVLRFTVFRGASERRLFGLATTYVVSTWLPLMALNFFEGRRLAKYLEIHHPRQWELISGISFMGVSCRNGFREMRWLYSYVGDL